jgi:hypothetical protein
MFTELSKYKNSSFKKYEGTNGMNTKFWGKALWNFLFTSILGRYPVKIENNNKEHLKIKEEYMKMIYSLKYTLPCIYCRDSFGGFLEKYPPEKFSNSRIELFYWLYLIKHQVNLKLIAQEKECYKNEKTLLKLKLKSNKITEKEYTQKLKEIKKEVFYTIPSPSFITVLERYEKNRAECSVKNKTCRK